MHTTPHIRTPRLISLDVFRGLTIALMIIVNSPGNSSPYSWLDHSIWNGCTLADLVFPFFIIIVGISSVLALSNLRAKGISTSILVEKVLKRSAYIFLMGLLLNAFPHHFDFSSLRILGVLQRIALCYLIASILFISTRIQTQALIATLLLVAYGCLMSLSGSLTEENNWVGYVDQLLFSPGHLYRPHFDPEGLLSTIPAVASALIGNLIGAFLLSTRTKQHKCLGLICSGVFLSVLGWFWSYELPLNKALWSSSYVLWTAGLSLLVYSLIYALIEMKHWIRWSRPFDLFGRHAMLVYMLHVLFLKIQALVQMPNALGQLVGFRVYICDVLFGYLSLENASLMYSISYTLLWLFVLFVFERYNKRACP